MSRNPKICHEKFVEMWTQNATAREIAEFFKVAVQYVYHYASDHRDDCPERIPGRPRKGNTVVIDLELFAKMWNNGDEVEKIAKTFGMAIQSVYQYAANHRNCCPVRDNKIKRREFFKLWLEGYSTSEIAEYFNVTVSSVQQYARRYKNFISLIVMWNDGVSIKEIAQKLNMSPSSVYGYAIRNTELCVPRQLPVKEIPLDEFVELWNDNVPAEEIAERYGFSESYVYKYAAQHRDVCPARRPLNLDDDEGKINLEVFVQMWNDEAPAEEIAEKFGVSNSYVYNFAIKYRNLCPTRKKVLDTERVIKLWNEGETAAKIADQLGFSIPYIYATVKRNRDRCPKRRP